MLLTLLCTGKHSHTLVYRENILTLLCTGKTFLHSCVEGKHSCVQGKHSCELGKRTKKSTSEPIRLCGGRQALILYTAAEVKISQVYIFWSNQSVCTAPRCCRQNVMANINGVLFCSSSSVYFLVPLLLFS